MSLEISPSVVASFVPFARSMGAACSWKFGESESGTTRFALRQRGAVTCTNLVDDFQQLRLLSRHQLSDDLDVIFIVKKRSKQSPGVLSRGRVVQQPAAYFVGIPAR